MDYPFQRLKKIRIAAGYESAAKAAAAIGVKTSTYERHENGSNGLSRSAARYAKFFNVSLDWLLRGEGSPELNEAAPTTTAAWIDTQILAEILTAAFHTQEPLGEDEAAQLSQDIIEISRMPLDLQSKLPARDQARFRAGTLLRLYARRAKPGKSKSRGH